MISDAERERFSTAAADIDAAYTDTGIGTLSEKSLHRTLKLYLENDPDFREVPYRGYVADILRDGNITEIQTSTLSALRDKLSCFCEDCTVRIVWPVIVKRRIVYMDPISGEISPSKRLAPKESITSSLLPQMIYISDLLLTGKITISAFLLSAEEYRLKGARIHRRRTVDVKVDRVPTELHDIIDYNLPADSALLIPDGLPDIFTSADFSALTHLKGRRLWAAVKVLEKLGAITRDTSCGKIRYIRV